MLAITANRLSSIRRSSRALLGFFILLSILFVIGTLNKMEHPFPPGARALAGIVFQGTALTGKIRILWLAQMVLGAGLSLKILYHFIRLLALFSKGELFTARNVAQIRQIGLTLTCAPAIWLVALIG